MRKLRVSVAILAVMLIAALPIIAQYNLSSMTLAVTSLSEVYFDFTGKSAKSINISEIPAAGAGPIAAMVRISDYAGGTADGQRYKMFYSDAGISITNVNFSGKLYLKVHSVGGSVTLIAWYTN